MLQFPPKLIHSGLVDVKLEGNEHPLFIDDLIVKGDFPKVEGVKIGHSLDPRTKWRKQGRKSDRPPINFR